MLHLFRFFNWRFRRFSVPCPAPSEQAVGTAARNRCTLNAIYRCLPRLVPHDKHRGTALVCFPVVSHLLLVDSPDAVCEAVIPPLWRDVAVNPLYLKEKLGPAVIVGSVGVWTLSWGICVLNRQGCQVKNVFRDGTPPIVFIVRLQYNSDIDIFRPGTNVFPTPRKIQE